MPRLFHSGIIFAFLLRPNRLAMPFSAQHIRAARLSLRKSDPVLAAIVKKVGPFTTKARRDRFGTLAGSILSQQISTKAASSIKGRVLEAIESNRQAPVKRGYPWCPLTLAQFTVPQYRELGVSRQKATYIIDLAEKVNDGTVDLAKMGRMADEDVIEELIQVKGIGRWTAQMFLMFSLARLDVLPVDDLGIKTAVRNAYGLDELPGKDQLNEIAVPWQPYRTIASWYLWRSLEIED